MLSGRLSRRELGDDIIVENRIFGGSTSFAANPCLDGIETLSSLMNIVEVGNVMKSAEQLEQALGSVVNRLERRNITALPDGVAPPRTNLTRHTIPRLSPPGSSAEQKQEYAIRAYFGTTNMRSCEDLHNIFGSERDEE